MYKVFIDGSAGTTGLKIVERLKERKDLSLITLPEELRKDVSARKEALNSADVAFLCLPDIASKETINLIENDKVVVIDTSTAHRTADGWTYGFCELKGQREKILNSKRIANPGCHASGFIALVKPLVDNGLIAKDANLSCFSLTGYSGGGKKMIESYGKDRPLSYEAPRQYGLTQSHKHLPEMKVLTGISNEPIFCPVVAPYIQGMQVTVPIFKSQLKGNINNVKEVLKNAYQGKVVKYLDVSEDGFISANAFANKDSMAISVFGNEDRILLIATYDNLGKGASGSAIQNMNIVLGLDETTGLNL